MIKRKVNQAEDKTEGKKKKKKRRLQEAKREGQEGKERERVHGDGRWGWVEGRGGKRVGREMGWQREEWRERGSSWRLEVGGGWKGEGNRGLERDRGGGGEREREGGRENSNSTWIVV